MHSYCLHVVQHALVNSVSVVGEGHVVRKLPDITGIFLFDNAPSHKKFDVNASNMNVYPGGKSSLKRWFVGEKYTKNDLT